MQVEPRPQEEQLEKIDLAEQGADKRPTMIGTTLSSGKREALVALLHQYRDVFAWTYKEMPGLPPSLVTHKLNVEPGAVPVKQPPRKFRPELELQIKAEVEGLLAVDFARPVIHPKWLANVVPVKKKNGQIRVCVDFWDLNKACPKDEFPLPNLDMLIDAVAGHKVLSFMDGFKGNNQIKMDEEDAEKRAFRTPFSNFCFNVMPFGVKNAGATCQRAMTAVFHDMLHDFMEDYVEDMVVKSKGEQEHFEHLRRVFERCR